MISRTNRFIKITNVKHGTKDGNFQIKCFKIQLLCILLLYIEELILLADPPSGLNCRIGLHRRFCSDVGWQSLARLALLAGAVSATLQWMNCAAARPSAARLERTG